MAAAAVLALLGGGGVAVAVLGGDDEAAPAAGEGPSSGSEDPATEEGEPAPKEPEEPARIMLGENQYVSPCQLVTERDVTRTFGPLRPTGYVRQTTVDASLSPKQMREETDTLTRSVRTTCSYNYGDDDTTSLDVQVAQYRTAEDAQAVVRHIRRLGSGAELRRIEREITLEGFEWVIEGTRELAESSGGVPVPGADDLLFVAGDAAYVTAAGNTVVRMTYLPLSFDDVRLSDRDRRFQDSRMKRLSRLVTERVAAAETLSQDPGPVVPDASDEWAPGVRYLDACDLATPAVFEALTGQPRFDPEIDRKGGFADPEDRKSSGDSPLARTTSNDCELGAFVDSESFNLDLEVRYAEDETVGEELLNQMIVDRYYDGRAERQVTVDDMVTAGLLTRETVDGVDTMLVFDSTPVTGRAERFMNGFFRIGPHVFSLSGTKGDGKGISFKQPTVGNLRNAAAALALEYGQLVPEESGEGSGEESAE